MTTTTVNITELETLIADARVRTGLTLRLGYIGNVDSHGDDRSWTVWIHNARRIGNGNLASVGYVHTDDLGELANHLDDEALAKALKNTRPVEVRSLGLAVETTLAESTALIAKLLTA